MLSTECSTKSGVDISSCGHGASHFTVYHTDFCHAKDARSRLKVPSTGSMSSDSKRASARPELSEPSSIKDPVDTGEPVAKSQRATRPRAAQTEQPPSWVSVTPGAHANTRATCRPMRPFWNSWMPSVGPAPATVLWANATTIGPSFPQMAQSPPVCIGRSALKLSSRGLVSLAHHRPLAPSCSPASGHR